MTDVVVRAVRFSTPTSTGSQDITASLGGKTPKACMILLGYHNAASGGDIETAMAQLTVGLTDGTRHRCSTTISQDAVNATNDKAVSVNHRFIYWINQNASDIIVATFTSFIADGVRVNFTAVDTTARDGIAIFFAGADLSAYVNDTGSLGSSATTTTVTGVGFNADAVLFTGTNTAVNGTGVAADQLAMLLGIAVNGGNQKSLALAEEYNVAAGGNPSARIVSDAAISALTNTSGALAFKGTVGNFVADGFDVVTSASSGSTSYPFLALDFGGLSSKVWTFSTPTTVSTATETTPNFFPQFGMVLGSNLEAVDTTYYDVQTAGGWGVGVFDDTESNVQVARISSVADPTDTNSTYVATALQTPTGLAVNGVVADLGAFTATGWTMAYTTVQATAKIMIGFAIEAGDPISGPVGVTFADFSDTGFEDWAIGSSDGADFSSYLNTYYIAGEDVMFWMQSPYVYVFLEEGTSSDQSLLFRGAWDWSENTTSKKWSRQEQSYKYLGNRLVAVSKKKVRGKGRVLQLRFESEAGKDFNLLGWGNMISKSDEP